MVANGATPLTSEETESKAKGVLSRYDDRLIGEPLDLARALLTLLELKGLAP